VKGATAPGTGPDGRVCRRRRRGAGWSTRERSPVLRRGTTTPLPGAGTVRLSRRLGVYAGPGRSSSTGISQRFRALGGNGVGLPAARDARGSASGLARARDRREHTSRTWRFVSTGRARVLVCTAAEDRPGTRGPSRSAGLRLVTVPWSTRRTFGHESRRATPRNMAAQDGRGRTREPTTPFWSPLTGTVLRSPHRRTSSGAEGREVLLTPYARTPADPRRCVTARSPTRDRGGGRPVEGAFPLARLFEADEVFVCSSIREVDAGRVGRRRQGPSALGPRGAQAAGGRLTATALRV